MIKSESLSSDWISERRKKYSKDPAIMEAMIYALYLLEYLKQTDLEFIFKGGTSLVLLMDQPKRFSVDIDIILNLVDSEIEKINVVGASVYSDHEDLANIQMIFKSGCVANITASRVTEHKIRTLAVTQKDAYIYLDYTDQDLHIHRQAASEYILTKEALRYKQESFIERIFVHKDNPLKLEILYFINSVMKKKKSNSEMENLRSLAMALDVVETLKKQKMIKNAS